MSVNYIEELFDFGLVEMCWRLLQSLAIEVWGVDGGNVCSVCIIMQLWFFSQIYLLCTFGQTLFHWIHSSYVSNQSCVHHCSRPQVLIWNNQLVKLSFTLLLVSTFLLLLKEKNS